MFCFASILSSGSQVRVQLGMPLQPEYDQTRTLGSTTGGFYPSIIEGSKKVLPPTVPPDVKLAVASFQPYFDPAFFPKVSPMDLLYWVPLCIWLIHAHRDTSFICTSPYCTALHLMAHHCMYVISPSLHFTSLHFTSLHFTSLHCTALDIASLCLASPRLTSPTSPHLTSPHLTSPHLTSPHLRPVARGLGPFGHPGTLQGQACLVE